jgi:hypothetical protein
MKKSVKENPDQKIKVSLSVPERFNLPALFPPRSSRMGNALSQSLRSKISFTPEEKKEYKIVMFPDGRYFYNPSKSREKEFTFEPFEILHIQQGISIHDLQETIADNEATTKLVEKIMALKVNTAPVE